MGMRTASATKETDSSMSMNKSKPLKFSGRPVSPDWHRVDHHLGPLSIAWLACIRPIVPAFRTLHAWIRGRMEKTGMCDVRRKHT